MTRTCMLAAVLALALPRLAAAQEAAPPLEENPKVARFADVERGFFIGFQFGYMGLFDTPTADPAKHLYAPASGGRAGGTVLAIEIGGDLTSRLALSLVAQGSNLRATPSYGAFSLVGGGLDLRYAYYGSKDRNDWERFFLYLHARGNYQKTYPEGLFGTNEILVQGGPGLEYFTRLRHFSIGLAVDYVYATKAKVSGVAAYPTVRYTF